MDAELGVTQSTGGGSSRSGIQSSLGTSREGPNLLVTQSTSAGNDFKFVTNWKPFPRDAHLLFNHVIDMIDSASRIEADHSENFTALNADKELLPKLNEALLELEEQREKIETVIKKDSTVISRHLMAMAEAIFDVFSFLDKLSDMKFLFLTKGKQKTKLQSLIHNVHMRLNQIMTYVSLDLTATNRAIELKIEKETNDTLAAEAYKFLYGLGEVTKNYATAYEKFSALAEKGHGESMYVISGFYKDGIVVRKDVGTWRDWLSRSASSGFSRAQCELALDMLGQVKHSNLHDT